MKLQFKSKSNVRQNLPLRPVFECGLMFYARVYSNGNRTVSFEDSSIRLQPHNNTYIGTNKTFELALSDAKYNFHLDKKSSALENINNRLQIIPNHIQELYITTDDWLAKHNGVIRAVVIEENTILVTLEGFTDVSDLRTRFYIEKTGTNFYNTLASTFAEFKNQDPNVKNIAVSYQ
jgi:hypothetical protein